MKETYQAEALDPNDLAAIVHASLLEIIGQKALDEAKEQTEADKAKLQKVLKNGFRKLAQD